MPRSGEWVTGASRKLVSAGRMLKRGCDFAFSSLTIRRQYSRWMKPSSVLNCVAIRARKIAIEWSELARLYGVWRASHGQKHYPRFGAGFGTRLVKTQFSTGA